MVDDDPLLVLIAFALAVLFIGGILYAIDYAICEIPVETIDSCSQVPF